MVDLADLLTDLADESAEVDAMVAPLSDVDWARPTPAEGWTVAHQIAHLAWTDHATLLANRDRLDCARIVLTHMSPDMLGRQSEAQLECAHDGLVVEL